MANASHRTLSRRLLLAGSAVLAAPRSAAAQGTWPTKPVRMVVPYGAGNLADHVARVLAEDLQRRWGQRVIADNQPGAGGAIGVAQIARAAPDGYTIGLVAMAALVITPHMTRAPYDPLSDLTPVAGVTVASGALTLRPGLGIDTLPDFVAAARARPAGDPFFYYSAGNGTVPHLNFEILRRTLDFPAQHVPYRTSAAGLADLLAGRVQATMDSFSVVLPAIRAGTLRAVVATPRTRLRELPEVPSIAEVAPQVQFAHAWQAVMAPAGLPPEITARIAADTKAALAVPGFAARMPAGAGLFDLGPDDLAAHMRRDHARFGALVAELGLRSE
jgi:tripartite-type tricarboxylate transporter receptor subunit TctC